jgi:hypothetical protein
LFPPAVLFLVQDPIQDSTSHLVNHSLRLLLLWLRQFWGALATYCVVCPSEIFLLLFSWLDFTTELKCHSHHGISGVHTIGLGHLTGCQMYVRHLHHKVLLLSFLPCTLGKEVTMHRSHGRNGDWTPLKGRVGTSANLQGLAFPPPPTYSPWSHFFRALKVLGCSFYTLHAGLIPFKVHLVLKPSPHPFLSWVVPPWSIVTVSLLQGKGTTESTLHVLSLCVTCNER